MKSPSLGKKEPRDSSQRVLLGLRLSRPFRIPYLAKRELLKVELVSRVTQGENHGQVQAHENAAAERRAQQQFISAPNRTPLIGNNQQISNEQNQIHVATMTEIKRSKHPGTAAAASPFGTDDPWPGSGTLLFL